MRISTTSGPAGSTAESETSKRGDIEKSRPEKGLRTYPASTPICAPRPLANFKTLKNAGDPISGLLSTARLCPAYTDEGERLHPLEENWMTAP